MELDTRWSVSVSNFLNGSFKQSKGESKTGTDWIIVLRRDNNERRVLVRTYCSASEQGSASQKDRAVEYVTSLLNHGWTPDNYQGNSGELTVPDDNVREQPALTTKPWWRFW